MVHQVYSRRGLLWMAGTLTLTIAARGTAAPPAPNYQGGLYPSYAYPYYPAFRPTNSYSSPGPSSSFRINPYNGYIPGNTFAPGFYPGFASLYARIAPSGNPTPASHTRFYIPLELSEGATRSADNTAHLEVIVPANASLWLNGWQSRSTGSVRKLQSPPLTPGRPYTYTVRARWEENGRAVTQTRQVPVSAGAQVRVNFLVGGTGEEGKK